MRWFPIDSSRDPNSIEKRTRCESAFTFFCSLFYSLQNIYLFFHFYFHFTSFLFLQKPDVVCYLEVRFSFGRFAFFATLLNEIGASNEPKLIYHSLIAE
jgi:hypothetical protein